MLTVFINHNYTFFWYLTLRNREIFQYLFNKRIQRSKMLIVVKRTLPELNRYNFDLNQEQWDQRTKKSMNPIRHWTPAFSTQEFDTWCYKLMGWVGAIDCI